MALRGVRSRREAGAGYSRLADSRSVGRALGATCLVSFVSAAIGQDSWQWRVNKIDDGRMLLAFSELEADDGMVGMTYYCKPSSGVVEVVGPTDKKQRRVFAELIRANRHPKVELEGEAALPNLSFSEVSGWEYRFEIDADGAAFDKFRKTGRFGFKIGALVVEGGMRKAGLDNVSIFQAACKRPLDAPKTQR
jgi:hypothetical protein